MYMYARKVRVTYSHSTLFVFIWFNSLLLYHLSRVWLFLVGVRTEHI